MRLLAPAVLLGFAALVVTGPVSAATPFANPPGAEQATEIQAAAPRAANPDALLPVASQHVSPSNAPQAPAPSTITLPVGTRVTLALTSPIWTSKVKSGDAVYAVTAFPAVGSNTMAIPAGTYVLGQIDSVTKPSWKDARAQFQMHFSKIIFANGYTLELETAPAQTATATVHVKVTSRNDVLLDNGTQFDMIVQTPLVLDANRVAQAVRLTHPLPLQAAKSATTCRLIPATPGTSDTVIPGTPGSPGTPDTVIPGVGGMPPTVIPGIPASPGTPPTIIPGTPGTPAIPCPPSSAVVSGPSGPQIHRQSFQLTSELIVSGKKLAPGDYQVAWLGTNVAVQVDLQQDGRTIVRVPARIASLQQSSAADKTETRANADGSATIASLEFAGEKFAVVFD